MVSFKDVSRNALFVKLKNEREEKKINLIEFFNLIKIDFLFLFCIIENRKVLLFSRKKVISLIKRLEFKARTSVLS